MDKSKYQGIQIKSHIPGKEALSYPGISNYYKTYDPRMSLNKDSTIMDIGCGEGTLLKMFHNDCFFNLYGVDISDVAIRKAKSKFSPTADVYSNLHVIDYHDIYEKFPLEYYEGFFDLIVSHYTLERCLDIDLILSNMSSLLSKNGTIWIVIPYEPTNLNKYGRGNAHTHPFSSEDQVKEEISKRFDIESFHRKIVRGSEFEIFAKKKKTPHQK